MTDQYLVADAYLVAIAHTVSEVASILGMDKESAKYAAEHKKLRSAFQREYLSVSGRLSSDTQTAYTLAFQFDLLDESHKKGAAERLIRLVMRGDFRIATGFAGTPGVLHALTQAGHLQVAYRMLQEKGCPSWLYPITMGATTIWERWDSLLPDGSINVSMIVRSQSSGTFPDGIARRNDVLQPLCAWSSGQLASHYRRRAQTSRCGLPPVRRRANARRDHHQRCRTHHDALWSGSGLMDVEEWFAESGLRGSAKYQCGSEAGREGRDGWKWETSAGSQIRGGAVAA